MIQLTQDFFFKRLFIVLLLQWSMHEMDMVNCRCKYFASFEDICFSKQKYLALQLTYFSPQFQICPHNEL